MIDLVCRDLSEKYNKDYIVDIFNVGYVPFIYEKVLQEHNVEISVVYCGTDRKQGYEQQIQRQGLNIEVREVPRNIESPDSNVDDISSTSQTKLRNFLFNGEYDKQKKLMPPQLLDMFDDIVKYIEKIKSKFSESKQLVLTEGISHIEDIPVDEFIEFIEDMLYANEPLITSIKYDGVQNLSFGIDEDGRIYTTRRKSFGSKQELWYSWQDIPKIPAYNQVRSATQFITTLYKRYKDIFMKYLGEYVGKPVEWECEVVSTMYTNVIRYNFGTSKLIYLRPLPKFTDKSIDIVELDERLKNLYEELKDVKITVETIQYVPSDDLTDIISKPISETWSTSTIEYFDIRKYLQHVKDVIEKKLQKLKEFLNTPVGNLVTDVPDEFKNLTVFEIIFISLNKVPKQYRPQLKQLREELAEKVRSEFMIPIKDILIQNVNDIISQEKQSEIEGVVLRKILKGSNEDALVKLVDREKFSKINKELHDIVKNLYIELGNTFEQLRQKLGLPNDVKITKENRASVIKQLAKDFSNTMFDTSEVEQVIKEFQGKVKEQIQNVSNMDDIMQVKTRVGVYDFDVSAIKERVIYELREFLQRLNKMLTYLEKYKSSGDTIYFIQVIYNSFLDETDVVEEHLNKLYKTIIESDTLDEIEQPFDDSLIRKLIKEYIEVTDNEMYKFELLDNNTYTVFISAPYLIKKFGIFTLPDLLNLIKSSLLKFVVNELEVTSPAQFVTELDNGVALKYKETVINVYTGILETLSIGKSLEQIEIDIINSDEMFGKFRGFLIQSLLENVDYRDKKLKLRLYNPQTGYYTVYQQVQSEKSFYIYRKQKTDPTSPQSISSEKLIPTDTDIMEILEEIFNVDLDITDVKTNDKLVETIAKKLFLPNDEVEKIFNTFMEYCKNYKILYPEILLIKYQ